MKVASFLNSLIGCLILALLWFFLHSWEDLLKDAVKEAALQYPTLSIKHLRSQWLLLSRLSWAGAGGVVVLSWLLTGEVVWAALGLLSFYPLLKWGSFFHFSRLQDRITVEFCSFLVALQGLLEAGIPFSQALHELSKRSESSLGVLLKRSLSRFEKGKAWRDLLKGKHWKNSTGLVYQSLQLLEVTSRRGLSLVPLVENLIPLFEKEIDTTKRLKLIRRNFLTQCLVCALIPWGVGCFAFWFYPEILNDFIKSSIGKVIVVFVFLAEGGGIWLTQKIIRFY